jgi:hypothetical protein
VVLLVEDVEAVELADVDGVCVLLDVDADVLVDVCCVLSVGADVLVVGSSLSSGMGGLWVGMASHISPRYPGAHCLHSTPVHLMLSQVHFPGDFVVVLLGFSWGEGIRIGV